MLVKELIKELEEEQEQPKGLLKDNHIKEQVLKIIIDTLEFYDKDKELASKDLEDILNDLTNYITQDMVYVTNDIIHEVNMYREQFDEVFNTFDNCMNEYIEVYDMTNTICDIYFEAYKIVLSNILSYYIQLAYNEEYEKRNK